MKVNVTIKGSIDLPERWTAPPYDPDTAFLAASYVYGSKHSIEDLAKMLKRYPNEIEVQMSTGTASKLRQRLLSFWAGLKVYPIVWWRKKVTCRCCATCAYWRSWDAKYTVGRCYVAKASPGRPLPTWKSSGSRCEKWRERMR